MFVFVNVQRGSSTHHLNVVAGNYCYYCSRIAAAAAAGRSWSGQLMLLLLLVSWVELICFFSGPRRCVSEVVMRLCNEDIYVLQGAND